MFTSDALDFISLLFNRTLELFQSVTIPGLTISVFELAIILVVLKLVITCVRFVFGVLFGHGGQRGGNNSRIRGISKEREGDIK